MKAVFAVPLPIEAYLPPMDSKNGYQLHYRRGNKVRGGIQGCEGPSPPTNGAPTQLLIVDVSHEVLILMQADEDLLFVEEVLDEPEESI